MLLNCYSAAEAMLPHVSRPGAELTSGDRFARRENLEAGRHAPSARLAHDLIPAKRLPSRPHQHWLFTIYVCAILAVTLLRRSLRTVMDCADSPRKPLGELIGNLSYTAPPEKRRLSGEATTKRRRIELQDPAATSILARKPRRKITDEAVPVKPKKRTKSPAKKPRTVTEAATAAYQPPPAFVEPTSTATILLAPEAVPPEKIKKPRKPRPEPGKASTAAPKKSSRPRKPKVTFQEALPPSLLSPQHARKQAEQQGFLFGTSSQLAAQESPTFIRQMQAAIIESELVPPTQAMAISPARMSCAKVPTAPHGTSLSVSQADGEHWRAASRDWKGGLLRLKVCKKPAKAATDLLKTAGVCSMPLNVIAPAQTVPTPVTNPQQVLASEPDSFIDIDDISDHEPPPTPSPPRRKASASPTPVKPLTFKIASPPAPAPVEQSAKIILASSAVLKATDAQWPLIKAKLFQQVTAAVKAAARSADPAKPSWHQKILLYDPIVLEDLTAWVNAQGLGLLVRRLETKKSVKARKKKGAERSTEAPLPDDPDYVEAREEVQAWMVQKWCEEKGICCLWKEGLRGGVRSNY
ncbi:5'-flap endonuclease [Friedmanniomyces endolithicus]|nr:5'-flap endonuclease [Friedmanniomyces endolithicus]